MTINDLAPTENTVSETVGSYSKNVRLHTGGPFYMLLKFVHNLLNHPRVEECSDITQLLDYLINKVIVMVLVKFHELLVRASRRGTTLVRFQTTEIGVPRSN